MSHPHDPPAGRPPVLLVSCTRCGRLHKQPDLMASHPLCEPCTRPPPVRR
ncbi:MAG: hypothetical protein QNK03_27570 [Myxococcota bacterium]|nr:hypothetical protein [Myxococcota bacterium]